MPVNLFSPVNSQRPCITALCVAILALSTIAMGAVKPIIAQTEAPPPIDQLIETLQTKLGSVHDFSAEFEHRYTGSMIQTTVVEHGTVSVKKPGKWIFNYTSPEEKLFISDGQTIYSYYPLDNQVIVAPAPRGAQPSTPTFFLAGRENLMLDFVGAYAETTHTKRGSLTIRLTPIRPSQNYDWLTLVVDELSLQISQLIATDLQGGTSSFIFSNLKENQGLADNLFTFEIPRYSDVFKH